MKTYRIAEYKQVGVNVVEEEKIVQDYDEEGNVIGQHTEMVRREVPKMELVYRDSTPEETARMEAEQAEYERQEAMREPTMEERIEAQVLYTALMTDTLIAEG